MFGEKETQLLKQFKKRDQGLNSLQFSQPSGLEMADNEEISFKRNQQNENLVANYKNIGNKKHQQGQNGDFDQQRSRRQRNYFMEYEMDEQDHNLDEEEEYHPRNLGRKRKNGKNHKSKPEAIKKSHFACDFSASLDIAKRNLLITEKQQEREQSQQIVNAIVEENSYTGHIFPEPFSIAQTQNLLSASELLFSSKLINKDDKAQFQEMKRNVFKYKDEKMDSERMKMLPKSMLISQKIFFTRFLQEFDCLYQKIKQETNPEEKCEESNTCHALSQGFQKYYKNQTSSNFLSKGQKVPTYGFQDAQRSHNQKREEKNTIKAKRSTNSYEEKSFYFEDIEKFLVSSAQNSLLKNSMNEQINLQQQDSQQKQAIQ